MNDFGDEPGTMPCTGDDCHCKRGLAVHPPILMVFDPDRREYVVLAPDAQAVWQDDLEHGRRLVVTGTTYMARHVIAYLVPINENDPEEGTFKLKTALAEPS